MIEAAGGGRGHYRTVEAEAVADGGGRAQLGSERLDGGWYQLPGLSDH